MFAPKSSQIIRVGGYIPHNSPPKHTLFDSVLRAVVRSFVVIPFYKHKNLCRLLSLLCTSTMEYPFILEFYFCTEKRSTIL